MGTITVTTTGFSALPASPPAKWPVGIVWPGNGTVAPNGSRNTTLSDSEMVELLTWVAAEQTAKGTEQAPTTPTVAQILVNWVNTWWRGTQDAVQRYFTTPPVVPPPIGLDQRTEVSK